MNSNPRSCLLLIALVMCPLGLFAANGPQIVRVLMPDQVRLERNGDRIENVRRGFELEVGDSIQTGTGAKVFISFPNGDSAVIGENTDILIEMYSYAEATDTLRTRLKMDEGEIIADLEKLRQNEYDPQFDVATKVGIAGIRGTQFVIRVRQDPLTGKIFANFGVTRGLVEVQLTGSAAIAARSVLNDVDAGSELTISGDYDASTGEITRIDAVNNIPITPETRSSVEQAVSEIIISREQEQSGEDQEGNEESKNGEESNTGDESNDDSASNDDNQTDSEENSNTTRDNSDEADSNTNSQTNEDTSSSNQQRITNTDQNTDRRVDVLPVSKPDLTEGAGRPSGSL